MSFGHALAQQTAEPVRIASWHRGTWTSCHLEGLFGFLGSPADAARLSAGVKPLPIPILYSIFALPAQPYPGGENGHNGARPYQACLESRNLPVRMTRSV